MFANLNFGFLTFIIAICMVELFSLTWMFIPFWREKLPCIGVIDEHVVFYVINEIQCYVKNSVL